MTREQLKQLEAELWRAADNLRANSELAASEYATPVLGLIFLKFADLKYARSEQKVEAEFQELVGTRIESSRAAITIKECGFYGSGKSSWYGLP